MAPYILGSDELIYPVGRSLPAGKSMPFIP